MSRQSETPQVLKISDVAKSLTVSRASVYRLIAAGKLRAVDMSVTGGRGIRVRADDLQQFIDARTATAPVATRQ